MADITIAELELQITSNTSMATKGLDALIVSLSNLKNKVQGGLGLTKVTHQITALGDAIRKFPKLEKFEQLRDILASIKGIGDIDITKGFKPEKAGLPMVIQETDKSLGQSTLGTQTQQQEKLNASADDTAQSFENARQSAEDFYNTILDASPLQVLQLKLEALGQKLKEAYNKNDLQGISNYASQIKTIQNQISKLTQDTTKSEKTTKSLTKTTKDLGNSANKAASGFSKLVKAFGRIALYRVLRSAIKAITSSIKEGIDNLYQFSKAGDGSFAKSMDTIATALLTIKNSIGVGLAPIIEALAPVIESLADKFMQLSNAIAKAGAIMNGKNTFTKATKSAKEYAESVKQAKSAAQSFDALNIANKDTTDYSTMFQEVSISEDTQDTATAFGQILKDLKEIVSELVTTLMPILRDIVGALLPIIRDILSNVIGYIKDIMPQLQEILGKIGEIIVTLLDKLQPVIDKILKSGIGQIILDIVTLINVILDELMPILDTIFELLEPIGDVISAIVKVVAEVIHSIINSGLIPILQDIFEFLQPIIEVVVEILKPVLEFIALIIEKIGGAVKVLSDVFGTLLRPVIQTVLDLTQGFFSLFTFNGDVIKKTWTDITDHIKDAWEKAFNGVKSIFVTIINGIITGFEKFVNFFVKAINEITSGLSSVWTWLGIPGIPQINEVSFTRLSYATGGYGIPKGQMFIANERGPELVGSMNNKTAVANNQQIVEGIKQGVYEAMLNAQSQEDGNKAINLNVYLSGKQLKAEYDRLTTASGVRLATGGIV